MKPSSQTPENNSKKYGLFRSAYSFLFKWLSIGITWLGLQVSILARWFRSGTDTAVLICMIFIALLVLAVIRWVAS